MIRPTKDITASLSRLEANYDFKDVVKWFTDSLAEQQDINIDLRGEEGIRGQGKAEVLRDIIGTLVNRPKRDTH